MAETRNQNQVIDSLYRISSLVSSTEDPSEALRFILEEIMQVLRPTSASISLVNPDSNRLEIEVESGLSPDKEEIELLLGEGITGWVALHAKPLLVPDVREEGRYVQINPEVRSEMAVPMEEQGLVIGVVNVDSEHVQAFDEEDLKILSLLTNEATRVVSKLWLIRQLKIKADQLQGLVRIGQRLGGSVQLKNAVDYLIREARKLLRCRMTALFFLEPDAHTMTLVSLNDSETGFDTLEYSFLVEDSAVGACLQFQKTVELPNLAHTEEGHFPDLIQERGLVSMLACPIVSEGKVIGTLHAYTDRPHRFNDDERKIFQTVANIGAVAIQNTRLYARVFSSQELLRKNEKLTTLGLMAAEIAHEIRNPLTVIKLLFDSLDLAFDPADERQKDVEIITEKLDQLEQTVGRVLSFGKSRQDMHARYSFHRLVEDTVALVRLKCRQRRIYIEYQPDSQELFIEGNKGQLQQAILNLIINSMEAIDPKADGNIRLRSEREIGEHQNFVVLYVEDDGSGIDASIQHQIFDSFLTQKKEGTGLGLSIVKRIMKSHRGDIVLKKTGPEGTTFKSWLPELKMS